MGMVRWFGRYAGEAAAEHARSEARSTVVSMVVDEPGSYGRIVRQPDGGADRIVEAAATAEELAVPEVNTGIYAMDIAWLRTATRSAASSKGEYYLTDCVAFAAAEGRAAVLVLDDPAEALGVNSQVERAPLHTCSGPNRHSRCSAV